MSSSPLLEAFTYLAATGLALIVAERRLLRGDAGDTRPVIWVLASFLLSGQVLANDRLTYPFQRWDMYSVTIAPSEYYRFLAKTSDSLFFDYPFTDIAPGSPGPMPGYSMLSPITWRLVQQQRLCRCDGADPTLDALIKGLTAAYRQRRGTVIREFQITTSPVRLDRSAAGRRILYRWSESADPEVRRR